MKDFSSLNQITFICEDKIEYQCCQPIMEEAKKRGYDVKVSDNQFEKCEIGFYLSHLNFPKNSKLSIITLHDLGQQHSHWPNIWKNEFWSDFDIALLPSKEWCNMWHGASCYDFARPRIGAFFTGWAKADRLKQNDFTENCNRILADFNLDSSKKTVLYAPSWEYDNRQLEMIESVKELNVNLLIKQFPYSEKDFPEQYRIINEVHKKSKDKPNVYILDSSVNIYDAISLCDVLVSEESSTLYEAMLLDKPVVAVTDWLVPDEIPARLPEFPYDFAIHTPKADLTQTIESILTNKEYLEQIRKYRNDNFPQIGNSAKCVIDIIDNVVHGSTNPVNRIEELELIKVPKEFRKSVLHRKIVLFKSKFKRTNLLGKLLYKIYKKFKCLNQ